MSMWHGSRLILFHQYKHSLSDSGFVFVEFVASYYSSITIA